MIVELRLLLNSDMLKVREWIMENSPNAILLVNEIVDNVFLEDWKPSSTGWAILDHISIHSEAYDDIFIWAVDIPDKDAVLFKLVWG